jgi:D-glycerate 3-kinase
VFEWRLKQEEKLRRQRTDDDSATRIMNEEQIRRFIQHYERITRNILREMPERADIVFELSEDQQIEKISAGLENQQHKLNQ